MQIVQERVQKGVTYLDANYPGWVDRIDVDVLDIACFRFCMLGQLEGSYSKGLERLGSNGGVSLGFDGNDLLVNKELTEEWKATIARLRSDRAADALPHAA